MQPMSTFFIIVGTCTVSGWIMRALEKLEGLA